MPILVNHWLTKFSAWLPHFYEITEKAKLDQFQKPDFKPFFENWSSFLVNQ